MTQLVVDLNWDNTDNSLRLKIYDPNGVEYGYFYDNADTRIDGRIYIGIRNSNGVPQGTWLYEVYGDKVTGTQDYTI